MFSPYCDGGEEDLGHILVSCSFAHLVWAISNLPWALISHGLCSMELWLMGVLQGPDAEDFVLVLLICLVPVQLLHLRGIGSTSSRSTCNGAEILAGWLRCTTS
ncbi:hypothetical protein Salat_2521700 [Sesamum alatum]|uniref:Uncharacterized protein n=1 Tax=Sesamum alatum TaxID=300844 RepID=A0AAE1XS41_9LAMI|nr:hypothetical protein Salat_2521700 [Sesamum alatum]